MKFFLYVVLLITLINSLTALRLLFILPCYGGHYATMSSLIASLSFSNDVTVVATSPLCETKVASLQKFANFSLIQADIGWGDVKVDGFIESFQFFWTTLAERSEVQFQFINTLLSSHRKEYDVMITDLTLDGVLAAGEVRDMPSVVIFAGITGATENLDEKMEISLFEAMVGQIIFRPHWNILLNRRLEHGLPEIENQGNLFGVEYQARFPAMLAGSPLTYPEIHPSIQHIYIGGIRNESHFEAVSQHILEWLNRDDRQVIYISLGTVCKISEASLQEWAKQIANQQKFRFIWSLHKDMKILVDKLGLQSDANLLFSEFLPQFTLLGHEKVKVFVTHGGLGSITDVIKRRKPAICSPQIFDQPFNCKKLTSAGVAETSSFEFDSIMETLDKIFDNYQQYVFNANRVAENYESYEKREAIEQFLAQVAAKNKTDIVLDFGFELASPWCKTVWLITRLCLIVISILLFAGFLKICKTLFRKFRKMSEKDKPKTT